MVSFNTINVPAGQLRTIEVRDNEVLTNVLIDITADGAGVFIDARGDGWEISNIGIRGQQPDVTQAPVNHLISVSTPPGGQGLVERVHATGGPEISPSNVRCLMARADDPDHHQGHVVIRDCHFSNWSAGGVRASTVAKRHGNDQGTVEVQNVFCFKNNIAGIQIATNGSEVNDCVVLQASSLPEHHSGRNGKGIHFDDGGTDLVVRNSDITHLPTIEGAAVVADNGSVGNLVNCQVKGPMEERDGAINLTGIGNNPFRMRPRPVPDSHRRAASTLSTSKANVLEIIANMEEDNSMTYSFTADGEINKHRTTHTIFAEDNDDVARNQDGSWTADGQVGETFGDAYLVDGDLTDFTSSSDKFKLRWNGTEVRVGQLLPGCRKDIDCPDGQVCSDGECVEKKEPPVSKPPLSKRNVLLGASVVGSIVYEATRDKGK